MVSGSELLILLCLCEVCIVQSEMEDELHVAKVVEHTVEPELGLPSFAQVIELRGEGKCHQDLKGQLLVGDLIDDKMAASCPYAEQQPYL